MISGQFISKAVLNRFVDNEKVQLTGTLVGNRIRMAADSSSAEPKPNENIRNKFEINGKLSEIIDLSNIKKTTQNGMQL